MKKAVLYARVSSELQQKERTIESQVAELKRQISAAGDVLVKEYVDDGFSGARLDRPAIDQLRKELKTDLFDTIYFLNTDRIARDVAYQNIIIAEILKYKKQIIINGKDYVHNPENKFTLTILGAVAELERAKIIERSKRGKLYKLKQGLPLNNGYNTYGYTYISRTDTTPASYVINEKEAKIVRYIFEAYANTKVSWSKMIRSLEDMGVLTKTGKKLWDTVKLTNMLKNSSYMGIKYFNTRTYVKESNNPLRGIKYGNKVYKDRSEWIGVKVPAVVSKELFDAAQARLEESRKIYRNPRESQLLSNLVRCGSCGRFFTSYQRYYRRYHKDMHGKMITYRIIHKVAYRCSRRTQQRMHSRNSDIIWCRNPEVATHLLESRVFGMIKEAMADPAKLQQYIYEIKDKPGLTQIGIEKQLNDIEQKMKKLNEEKRHVLDSYAIGRINRREYSQQCLGYDKEVNKAKAARKDLLKRISTLHKSEAVDMSTKQYCNSVKTQLEKCTDFDSKRQLLLDYVEKVIYRDGHVTLQGSVPITIKAHEDPDQLSEGGKIPFSIEDTILRQRGGM